MTNNSGRVVIDKGFYNHSQSSGQIQLKQYIVVRENDKKCLLLRFFNESDLIIQSMDIVLTQIRAHGKESKLTKLKLNRINVHPGEIYTTESGIVISDDCVDFRIEIKSVSSRDYTYRESRGRLIPKYDPHAKDVGMIKRRGKLSAKRKRISASKISILLAMVGIIGFIALGAYFSNRTFGSFDTLFLY